MFGEQAVQFDADETNIPLKDNLGASKNASVRYEQFVKSLKSETFEAFRASQVKRSYPKLSVLYEAGEASTGIYVIEEGRIKLSMTGGRNESVHSRTARRGEILGLCPTVSGRLHEVSAYVMVPSQVTFIPKDAFVKLMYQDSEFAFHVLHFLCADFGKALEQDQRTALATGGLGSRRKVTNRVL
jgi:CRP/FNR family transcriptional regulator